MIQIAGQHIPLQQLLQQWSLTREQREMVETMARSSFTYRYPSSESLQFELDMRKNILGAANGLLRSGAKFATFKNAKANKAYWQVTDNGGFLLKPGVPPETAINDIFRNGKKYAFECATAIPIIFYKAILDTMGPQLFNRYFSGLYLYSWNLDPDLGLITAEPQDIILADVLYFKNPQVNPKTMEWQGVNVVYLGNNRYYGHGIGIRSGEEIISILQRFQQEGATQTPFLMDTVTRPRFDQLYQYTQRLAEADTESVSEYQRMRKVYLLNNFKVDESITYSDFRQLSSQPIRVQLRVRD